MTPRQARRRQRIIAATESLLMERGYDGTSMRAIADLADVTEMTLYNIYGSKSKLIATYLHGLTAASFQKAADAKPRGGFPFLLQLLQEVVDSSLALPAVAREGVSVIMNHREVMSSNQLFSEYVGKALQQMVEKEALEKDALYERLVRKFAYAVLSGQLLWSHNFLRDDELLPYLEIQLYQLLLQYATPKTDGRYRKRLKTLNKKLGNAPLQVLR